MGSREPDERRTARAIALACRLDVAAPKAGNVHFGQGFDDVSAVDFMRAGRAIADPLSRAGTRGVGRSVLEAVRAMRGQVGSNTHLGTILLLAPLAAAGVPDRETVRSVLQGLNADDAGHVYEAIRIAQPGGLGTVESMDVATSPPSSLLHAMRAAADRDSIAAQYANDFRDLWQLVVPALADVPEHYRTGDWLALLDAIVRAHLDVLAELGDSLILRKCGRRLWNDSRRRAARVREAARVSSSVAVTSVPEFQAFDRWLRADGHRRNPGTTADLITAGLYIVLRRADLPE